MKKVRKIIDRVLDGHMKEVLSKGAIAFLLKMAGAGLAFGFHVAITRQLGAQGAGLYFLSLTIITLVALLGRMGTDNSVTRYVAENASVQAWAAVKGVVRHAVWITLGVSLLLSALIFVLADWGAAVVFSEPGLAEPLRYMALAIVPFAWMTVQAKALQGLKNVRDSMLIQSVLVPLVAGALVLLLAPEFGVNGAAMAYVAGASVALIYGVFRWRAAMAGQKQVAPSFAVRDLMRSSTPLLGAMLIQQLTQALPVLLLGVWASSSEVGLFGAANRAAMLVGLVLIAANSIIAPKMAALYRQGEMESLGRMTRHSALLLTLMALPAIGLFLLAPQWVMSLFGREFTDAWLMLVVMALGQLVNVMTGSVGFLLMMTGREKSYLGANLAALALCAVLCAALIPWFGGLGAAAAAAASLAVVNLLRVRYVWREMGIMALPLPSRAFR